MIARAWIACWLGLVLGATASAQTDLATLVEQLGGEDEHASSRAYARLRGRRDPALIPLIAKGINRFSPFGQEHAVALLRRFPIARTSAVYRKMLGAERSYLRVAAASALAALGKPGIFDELARAIVATPDEDRMAALQVVDFEEDQRVFEALLGWLHRDAKAEIARDVLVRLESEVRLRPSARRTASLRAASRRLLTAAGEEVRVPALAYLAGFDPALGDALAEILEESPRVFLDVIDLLDTERRLPPRLVAAMAEALDLAMASHAFERALEIVKRQSRNAAIQALRKRLQRGSEVVRSNTLERLAAIPGALGDQELLKMLHGENVRACIIAVSALRRRDDLSGLPVLLELLPHAGQHRSEAVKALAEFRLRRVGPVLLDMLDDDDTSVRREAWGGLRRLIPTLFPYRRFDFSICSYDPLAAPRASGIEELRTWWANASTPKRKRARE